jgi:7-carboxy-7-deazaguanine synthase
MKISEVFFSIQGEGTLAGVPSVFIRLSGCNLRCVWCDTPYASWNPQFQERTISSLMDEVRATGAKHAVVTGGEPMILEEVVELTQGLKALGCHITIETAGTVFQPVACDLMSISPKLANSTPHLREGGRWAAQHERLRYQPDVLRQLMERYEYQLKFVVSEREDLAEIERMAEETKADPTRLILMPEGTDTATIRQRAQWVAEICKQEGFRYGPRLHIDIWGDQRGV